MTKLTKRALQFIKSKFTKSDGEYQELSEGIAPPDTTTPNAKARQSAVKAAKTAKQSSKKTSQRNAQYGDYSYDEGLGNLNPHCSQDTQRAYALSRIKHDSELAQDNNIDNKTTKRKRQSATNKTMDSEFALEQQIDVSKVSHALYEKNDTADIEKVKRAVSTPASNRSPSVKNVKRQTADDVVTSQVYPPNDCAVCRRNRTKTADSTTKKQNAKTQASANVNKVDNPSLPTDKKISKAHQEEISAHGGYSRKAKRPLIKNPDYKMIDRTDSSADTSKS